MQYTPKQLILTAGPKISKNEVSYVTDAVKHGWNRHHSDYLFKFEEAFATYVGVKYALTMPTGTSALHVALLLFGVGPGDEVIVPDFTYVACSNVVHYTGATPIFVDVDRETWSIDATKLEKHITKRTKAIMPVHLYGNLADIEGINSIAKKHKLFVLEDACEALGCTWKGKHAGSLSHAAAFSFQGAKLLAIGEGGMFVTDRKDWIERARSLVDHGVSFKKQMWADEIGYMYPMNNVSAALGLARLEEIKDLVARKRKIFEWYKERLGNIEGLRLNPERKGLCSSFWMNTIILEKDFGISRDNLRKKLREAQVDTRPLFFPISDLGFYKTRKIPTPNAHNISYNGINLPSGVMLTEKEVDYVARMVRKFLHV